MNRVQLPLEFSENTYISEINENEVITINYYFYNKFESHGRWRVYCKINFIDILTSISFDFSEITYDSEFISEIKELNFDNVEAAQLLYFEKYLKYPCNFRDKVFIQFLELRRNNSI